MIKHGHGLEQQHAAQDSNGLNNFSGDHYGIGSGGTIVIGSKIGGGLGLGLPQSRMVAEVATYVPTYIYQSV